MESEEIIEVVESIKGSTIKKFLYNDGEVKVPAGWLIDQAGWKGHRNETVGIHNKQALVIVNHHQGTQADILSLAKSVQDSVFKKFKVSLDIEPVVVHG